MAPDEMGLILAELLRDSNVACTSLLVYEYFLQFDDEVCNSTLS